MINQVRDFLEKYKIKNKKVIVGFSAGPDSTALAFILSKLSEEFNLSLVLAYFNHNWRVEESKIEQEFALNFANKISAKFYTKEAPLTSPKTEETARDLRYAFFEEAMEEFNSDIVFLAHNKNDNIETAIYRIIKGTGVKGLCSILPVRDNYYRPLLNIEKAKILDFLKKENVEYKIDSSNEDVKYKRNLIRKEILPLFEKINPSYMTSVENLIKNALSTREIVEDVLCQKIEQVIVDDFIIREEYICQKQSVRYEILNEFIGDKLKYRNYKNIKKFDDFILNNKSSQISVNRELYLKIKKNKIYFVKHNDYDNKEN